MAGAGAGAEREALARDCSALVACPSPTGDERAALELLGAQAEALGLQASLDRHDLDALRAHPDHPGEEAPRDELWGLRVVRPARPGARRLALCGHVDVVGPGAEPWRHGPWSGAVEAGLLHGRGSVDMKAAIVAALHALAAAPETPDVEVVLLAVASEEDGGLGAFAALEADDRYDACLIVEPTGFDVVCAQAGALTFAGEVHGRGAHAALRLHGRSAIDAYIEEVHGALAAHERAVNEAVSDPLLAALELPCPISVGRLQAGEWSSSVPDRARFEGRLGVPTGQSLAEAEAGLRAALADLPVELSFTGGRFAAGSTEPSHPFAGLVLDAYRAATGHDSRPAAVSYGADMRLFCARGIPCVMAGTPGLERAHAVDEHVALADLDRLRDAVVGVVAGFGALPAPGAPVPSSRG